MIKNLIFDMGQVLIDFNPVAFAARLDLSPEDRQLLIEELFEGNANWALCDWGYITEEEVARRAFPRLPERLHEAAMELTTHWWEPIIPIEGAEDMVREFKEQGYGIYLLSNAGSTHNHYWQFVPGHQYFDGVVASANEKLVKPQPEIYRLTLERFGLKAEECVFADDRITNLAGAEVCGIRSLLFTTPEKFKKDLKELENRA